MKQGLYYTETVRPQTGDEEFSEEDIVRRIECLQNMEEKLGLCGGDLIYPGELEPGWKPEDEEGWKEG